MTISTDNKILIDWAREISESHPFWDFHAHPFCVLSGNTSYKPNNKLPGLYSTHDSTYRFLKFEQWSTPPSKKNSYQSKAITERALLLSSRLKYTFSGPKVFSDFIDQIGISNVMLLPFVRKSGNASEMVDKMATMFSGDSRFKFGCPLPVKLSPAKYDEFIENAIRNWNIQCIKVHPNLSGIDPLSKEGQSALYSILEIAGRRKLPIVVHGGRTPGISPQRYQEFGTLSRLAKIDWSVSSAPVIIAHAGCYGLDEDELDSAIFCVESMFKGHSNLMVDTSALDINVLRQLMTRLDRKRFIFGSDALYFSIWSGWLTLLQVLTSLSSHPEEDLIQIASVNPNNCLPHLD